MSLLDLFVNVFALPARLNLIYRNGIFKRYLEIYSIEKKWWLAPVIIVLLLLGMIIVLGGGTAIAPFIYTLF